MASINRGPVDGVVLSRRVFRAIVELARRWPSIDRELDDELTMACAADGVSLDLLNPPLRLHMEQALRYACRCVAEREVAIDADRFDPEDGPLSSAAEMVLAFLVGGATGA